MALGARVVIRSVFCGWSDCSSPSAVRAAELGLINRAVPGDQLDAAVAEVIADLRRGGPEALGLAKRLVYEVPRREQADAVQWTTELSSQLGSLYY